MSESAVSGAGRKLPVLTLHVRDGCHLCEDMRQQLTELLAPDSHQLLQIDIDTDAALQARYNTQVPVLSLDGIELCHHFLDLTAVQTALASYNRELPSVT